MTFDRDELAALLLEAAQGLKPRDEPGTITTPEFQAATGYSAKRAIDALDAAHVAGLVEPTMVGRVTRQGFAQRRAGWRFTERPEGQAASE